MQQSLLYLRSPQESMREAAIRFLGEPQPPGGPSLPHCSLAPGPAAAPAAGIGPVAVEPRLPNAGPGRPRGALPPSPTPATLSHPCPWASRWGKPWAQPCQGEEGVWPGWQGWCGGALPLGPVTGCVFLGLAGRRMRGQQEKLQVIYKGE